jgi:hypothetical protein
MPNRRAYIQLTAESVGVSSDSPDSYIRIPDKYLDEIFDSVTESKGNEILTGVAPVWDNTNGGWVRTKTENPESQIALVPFARQTDAQGVGVDGLSQIAWVSPIGFSDPEISTVCGMLIRTSVLLVALQARNFVHSNLDSRCLEIQYSLTPLGLVGSEIANQQLGGEFSIEATMHGGSSTFYHRIALLEHMLTDDVHNALEAFHDAFSRLRGGEDPNTITLGEDDKSMWFESVTKAKAKRWRKDGLINGSAKRGFKLTVDGEDYLRMMRLDTSMNLTDQDFISKVNEVLRSGSLLGGRTRKRAQHGTRPSLNQAPTPKPLQKRDISAVLDTLSQRMGLTSDRIIELASMCGFTVTPDGVLQSTKRLSGEFAPRIGEVLHQILGLDLLMADEPLDFGDTDPKNNPNVVIWLRVLRSDIDHAGKGVSRTEIMEEAFHAGVLYRQGILDLYSKYDIPTQSLMLSWDDWENDSREVFEIEQIQAFSRGFLFGRSWSFELAPNQEDLEELADRTGFVRLHNALPIFQLFRNEAVSVRLLACVTSLCRPELSKVKKVNGGVDLPGYYYPAAATYLGTALRNLAENDFLSAMDDKLIALKRGGATFGYMRQIYSGATAIMQDWDGPWVRNLIQQMAQNITLETPIGDPSLLPAKPVKSIEPYPLPTEMPDLETIQPEPQEKVTRPEPLVLQAKPAERAPGPCHLTEEMTTRLHAAWGIPD